MFQNSCTLSNNVLVLEFSFAKIIFQLQKAKNCLQLLDQENMVSEKAIQKPHFVVASIAICNINWCIILQKKGSFLDQLLFSFVYSNFLFQPDSTLYQSLQHVAKKYVDL